MDTNGGKPLSPWKVPSRISLKRIRHKINSDLSLQTLSSATNDRNGPKASGKRNRPMINKFALARSISTPTSDENVTPILATSTSDKNDEHLLAKLHRIMPPPDLITNDLHFQSTMRSFSFEEPFTSAESSKTSDEILLSFPPDWSLKSSCRFLTPHPSGFLNNFMKLRSTDESLALEYVCSKTNTDNEKALFRSLTSYWTYPHIAWLKLFPRSQQQQQSNANFAPLDEQAQLALQDEWKSAFQSLFQAFRTRYVTYFYMATHTFNVLFREDASSQIVAVISPTTSGLRSTLEREGIEFTMAKYVHSSTSDGLSFSPAVDFEGDYNQSDTSNRTSSRTVYRQLTSVDKLSIPPKSCSLSEPRSAHLRSTTMKLSHFCSGDDSLNNSANKNNDDNDDDEDENGEENDTTCAQWLEDMGLSASSSTNATSDRRCASSKKKSSAGKTPSSTILLRDLSSVNSLFNFLLNKSQRTCMALTGPLAGIPPTLISPRPFLHSTLKYLNVYFQSNSMVTIDGGPLLPDRLNGLWHLLTDKTERIQMTCTNVERTSALNLDGEQGRTIKQIQLDDNRHLRVQFAAV